MDRHSKERREMGKRRARRSGAVLPTATDCEVPPQVYASIDGRLRINEKQKEGKYLKLKTLTEKRTSLIFHHFSTRQSFSIYVDVLLKCYWIMRSHICFFKSFSTVLFPSFFFSILSFSIFTPADIEERSVGERGGADRSCLYLLSLLLHLYVYIYVSLKWMYCS